MEFPLICKESKAKKRTCVWCGKMDIGEPGDFAAIVGGAMLIDHRGDGGPSDNMEGFASILWHPSHGPGVSTAASEAGTEVPLATEVVGGQFELTLCSTECLRSLLNDWVTQLEHRRDRSRQKIQ